MRSKIAKRILDETPQEVRDEVKAYGDRVVNSARGYTEGSDEFVKGEPKTDLSGIQFESERLESENKQLREKYDAVVEALKDIIRFCEQFPISDSKKETLNEYKKLIP